MERDDDGGYKYAVLRDMVTHRGWGGPGLYERGVMEGLAEERTQHKRREMWEAAIPFLTLV